MYHIFPVDLFWMAIYNTEVAYVHPLREVGP